MTTKDAKKTKSSTFNKRDSREKRENNCDGKPRRKARNRKSNLNFMMSYFMVRSMCVCIIHGIFDEAVSVDVILFLSSKKPSRAACFLLKWIPFYFHVEVSPNIYTYVKNYCKCVVLHQLSASIANQLTYFAKYSLVVFPYRNLQRAE